MNKEYQPVENDTYECPDCLKPCKNREELRFHKCKTESKKEKN